MAKRKVQEYFENRANFYNSLTPGEIKANDDITNARESILAEVKTNKDTLNNQANEYERAHTSFFAVTISVIIAGMLNSPPAQNATKPAKIFYLASIISAAVVAVLLFFEYSISKRAFKKWAEDDSKVAEYVNSEKWSPDTYNEWIKDHNEKAKTETVRFIFLAQEFLLSVSLLLLVCWLYEILFNPSWFIFK